MKLIYAIGFALVGIILLFCTYKASHNERKIAQDIKWVFYHAFFAVVANIVVTLTTNQKVCMAAYNVFCVCIDWLLLDILLFVLDFSGIDSKGRRYVKPRLWKLLLALDSASLLLNYFFQHAYECVPIYTETGELCFHPVYGIAYYIHLAVAYFLVICSFLTLIYKASKTPRVYRMKYVVVLFILAFIVIGDAAFIFTDTVFNTSVIFFALGAIVIYYFAVVYAPKDLMQRTLSMVVQGMDDAIFIFDEDGNCIHVNDSARKLMRVEALTLQSIEKEFADWCSKNDYRRERGKEYSVVRTYGERKVHYKMFFRSLLDEKQCYLGGFFTVQDRTEEVNNLEREHYAANHDELTGIYNRQCFYNYVAERLRTDTESDYLIVCSDIRNFKMINDIFGTERGDKLLIRIGKSLRLCTKEDEIYARLESDRFGLLMKKEYFKEEIFTKEATRVLHIEGNEAYPIQLCIGVYEVTDREVPVSVMCDRALMAAATLKGNYGRQIAYYDEELRRSVLREQELTGELEDAIATRQFKMYLQPQMDGEGKMLGAEALVRWIHPVKGMISPAEFIGVFERNGTITKLDYYMWETACMQLRKWKEQGREDLYISVNISPKDFYFMDVYKAFTELVAKHGISPANLKLEITETAMMSELERQRKLIARLRAAGFVVEMDDFGSGYSSLNMLKDIQVDTLKIDMAFLGKTDNEDRASKILKMVVELSKQLEIPVITEGVETHDQVEFLRKIGCDMFQGYYFAKPMDVSAFEEKYL